MLRSGLLGRSVARRGAWEIARRGVMTEITKGVVFDTIAREWRCKWSADDDKASLAKLQEVLEEAKPKIKEVKGVKQVQRVVCGDCLDFKISIAVDQANFAPWAEGGFEPEASVLAKMKEIPGVSLVETQTYTLMPVDL
ncbi:Hypothetical protein SCF082_LOCUS6576 [Durusdinium trenchii]|uniref:Uncharacterized protein n=1 Tax=Durusdinium trenchii TaxID=1381693 RepID=A0ABP0IDE8_9DINO